MDVAAIRTAPGKMSYRIPASTYRLQFHAGFTFQQATGLLDYLEALGITDVYSSPFFQAGQGSTHGYDVADHNALNPSVGEESDFRNFVKNLRMRGMGQILDFVPNHMGISESLNVWWTDVLEYGPASTYARYFDINWHPGRRALEDKLVLPILGSRYGECLENGEFSVGRTGGQFSVNYFESKLPINPGTYGHYIRPVMQELSPAEQDELEWILSRFEGEAGTHPAAKADLEALAASRPAIAAVLDSAAARLRGQPGNPGTYDELHGLLEKQFYRLSYWRVASEEINYRRFFDINTLAAIRTELPEVFDASHHFVFELLSRGDVTGLRIDHVDGLWDPRSYLRTLQDRFLQITGASPCEKPLYVVVEKILDPVREQIPADWPVAGTTGYEFANQIVGLLVDSGAEKEMTRIYERFSGRPASYQELVYEKKRLIMDTSFQSELQALARLLDGISEMHRNYRDFTPALLMTALREVIACFPVYRTYATGEDGISETDEKHVLRATSLARRRNPAIEKPVFDFLRNLLLMRLPEVLSGPQREAQTRFVMKFQQCTGPITAKGVEDTVLYLFNRLLALNEVGGNPGIFGLPMPEFHRLNTERYERTPHTLLASSTHDTKRSEDVRLRIAALTEISTLWRKSAFKWHRLNKKFKTLVEGDPAPSRNEEYFLYQTLAGAWPLDEAEAGSKEFVERIQTYLIKSLKEAKVHSSWVDPDIEWEKASMDFVASLLDPAKGRAFRAAFSPVAAQVARLGAWNSLSALILKCCCPGIPDIYQGTEIWDFSLVDPDNRRPVDFQARRHLLESLSEPRDLLSDWKSGRIKLFVLQHLLRHRKENAAFYQQADYRPLATGGTFSESLVAFSRNFGEASLIVVVPRLTNRIAEVPVGACWADTRVLTGREGGQDLFTGKVHAPGGLSLPVSDLFARYPFAVLWQPAINQQIL